jgi:hypothetical protein
MKKLAIPLVLCAMLAAPVAADVTDHGRGVSQLVEILPVRLEDFVMFFMTMSSGSFSRDSVYGPVYIKGDATHYPDIQKASGPEWVNFPNGAVFADHQNPHPQLHMDLVTSAPAMDISYAHSSFPGCSDPELIDGVAEWHEGWMLNGPEFDIKLFSTDGVRDRAYENVATGRGLVIPTGATTITMNGHIVRLQNDHYPVPSFIDLSAGPFYIWSEAAIEIQGELDGQLAVGSTRIIDQIGDLTYTDDPRVVPESDDMLVLATLQDFTIKVRDQDVTTMARIIGPTKNLNIVSGASDDMNWWRFFGSMAAVGYQPGESGRRQHSLYLDWRKPFVSIGFEGPIYYFKQEHGKSWVELHK